MPVAVTYVNTDLPTVSDIETARQVFVARAMNYGTGRGYLTHIDNCLRAIGLGDYMPEAEGDSYTIKTASLFERLGSEFTIALRTGRTPRNNGRVTDHLYGQLVDWTVNLTEADWTKASANDKVIDVAAVCDEYGYRDSLPPASDEAIGEWERLIKLAGAWADDASAHPGDGVLCRSFEDTLRYLGFGDFTAPQYGPIEVTWRGVTVSLDRMLLNRDGTPRADNLYNYLADKIARDADELTFVVPASS